MSMINVCLNRLNIMVFPDRYPLLVLYFKDTIYFAFYSVFKFLLVPYVANFKVNFQGSILIFKAQILSF